MSNTEMAQAVWDYMNQRAESEGVPHDLGLDFYSVCLEGGMRDFFGVIVSDDGCRLLKDEQNPEFFKTYSHH